MAHVTRPVTASAAGHAACALREPLRHSTSPGWHGDRLRRVPCRGGGPHALGRGRAMLTRMPPARALPRTHPQMEDGAAVVHNTDEIEVDLVESELRTFLRPSSAVHAKVKKKSRAWRRLTKRIAHARGWTLHVQRALGRLIAGRSMLDEGERSAPDPVISWTVVTHPPLRESRQSVS
jgi:hypothetical protein